MKLHILSDLPIEFAHFELPETDADVIVLAGDVGVGMTGVECTRFVSFDLTTVPQWGIINP